uniref:Major capsid protein n=1 Tax=Panagrolaimus davidi TaxID=227884 RepID=A0A914QTX6_9BILA
MEKLDPTSDEILPTSVDFFNTKPNLVAFQNFSSVQYPPLTPIENGQIHFTLNTGPIYLDLSETYLHTKFKITKKEGDKWVPITNKDPVSLIQGFGATCIKTIIVKFNKRAIYHANNMHAYNAYFRRRLGLEVSRKEGTLQAAGYFEDGLDQMSGPGFDARRALFENGQTFESICSLDVGFFRQNKLLINHTVVDVEITLHNNPFALLATGTGEYKYQVIGCNLYTKQHMLFPQLDSEIQDRLNKDMLAKYDYTRNITNNYHIPPGVYEFRMPLFTDYIPKRVFAALVDARAFHGIIGMSPFEFSSHNLESIQIYANATHVPTDKYEFEGKNLTRAFKDLNDATDEMHGINYLKFIKHSCIFAFDLQSQHSDDFVETRQEGSTSITLNFKEKTPANGLQLIIYAEFNSILAMDKTRTITTTVPI